MQHIDDVALRSILLRCLAPRAEDRFGDALQLAESVARFRRRDRAGRRRFSIFAVAAVAAIVATLAIWKHLVTEAPEASTRDPFAHIRNQWRNSMGMEFARVPAGRFVMGLARQEGQVTADEVQREVSIDTPILISIWEVPQSVYERVMDDNPSRFKGPDLPVERVTQAEAMEFCRRLGEIEGRMYRLPTEPEWEYACRAGSTTRWNFGDEEALLMRYANLADESNTDGLVSRVPWNDGFPHTAPVNAFHGNTWGLQNVHGNVWEWCAGVYRINPTDPTTEVVGRAPIRGGSWYDGPSSAESGHRNPVPEGLREDNIGFRIVCEIPVSP